MSAFLISFKDGAKYMRPVLTEEAFRKLRNSKKQRDTVKIIREGDDKWKKALIQMNYSCLPNEDGSLKGATRMSTSIAMDVDHIPAEEMEAVKERILNKKEELGLLMLELSARAQGYHLVFKRKPELTQEENLKWASELLGVEFDKGAKDITRVFYTTTGSEEDLIFLSNELFENEECVKQARGIADRVRKSKIRRSQWGSGSDDGSGAEGGMTPPPCGHPLLEGEAQSAAAQSDENQTPTGNARQASPSQRGVGGSNNASPANDRTRFIAQGVMKEKNLKEADFINEGGRHTTVKIFLSGATQLLTKEEANGILAELMPEHWNDENIQQLINDFYAKYNDPTQRLFKYQEEIFTQSQRMEDGRGKREEGRGKMEDVEDEELSTINCQLSTRKLPQGVKDSIDAVGPQLAMPVVTAICPCIGALATGVRLDVHGQKRGLNLIAYIAGDFASGKGQIDPVIDAWMSEVAALDKMYQMQEDEWRAKKRAAKNKKDQPEEPKLPVRYLTLNNTVANLAERLANTEGKHAFSFTPEADTVAQKWRSSLSDFSIMLRQSYDGTKYEREARSADAVNVHIERLLWNVTMCGTPDALYRVVSNYTDGFQSRLAIARTPDNTFAPLEDKPFVLNERQASHIQQIAHLLPLMQGEIELPKLEQKGREWVENIRLETMKNDDRTMARQRMRVCVTAQRMTCCVMLCKVCETLIQKHGLNGAETRLKQNPNLWKEMLVRAQTPQMLEIYDDIADSLLENALYFFRERIENAFMSRDYIGHRGEGRVLRGRNDTIFERLDTQFTFDQAVQYSVAIKGATVTRNSVRQMLKNWRSQGLIVEVEERTYRKL